MLEGLLGELSARPVLLRGNRNVLATLLRDRTGRSAVFLMNPHAGVQSTELSLYDEGRV